MAIQGSVPVANRGVVDVGKTIPGTGVGIFEDTVVHGKTYHTVLTFKNMPVTLTKGANAGFVGIEAYDFGLGYLNLKGLNVAIAATEQDANLTGNLSVLVGTVTGTDLVTPGATEKNIIAVTGSASGTYSTAGKVIALNARSAAGAYTATAGAQLIDGTAAAVKFFLNLNATFANMTATSKLVLNGTIEFAYEDLGGDLAVGV